MDAQTVMQDPDFHSLPNTEKAKVLREVDPDFAGLPASEQTKVVLTLRPETSGDAIQDQPAALQLENTGRPFNEEVIRPKDSSQPSLIGLQTPVERDLSLLKKIGKQSARATLELGGATLAGVGGALLTRNPLAIAGLGAGGYATGKGLADYFLGENNTVDVPLDENGNAQMAAPRPMTIGEMAGKTATDFGTGIAMETLGAGVPAIGGLAMKGYRAIKPTVTKSGIQGAAGRAYNELLDVPNAYVNNATEADSIAQAIPGMKFNPAQRSGAPSVARDLKARMTGPLQDVAEAGVADQNRTLANYLQNNVGGNGTVDDLYRALEGNAANLDRTVSQSVPELPAGTRPYDTGKTIIDSVGAAEAPIKKAAQELYAKVPNEYPMSATNFKNEYRRLQTAPDVPASVSDKIKAILDRDKYSSAIGEGATTVGNMRAIKSELKALESSYIKDGDKDSARYVEALKDAYKKDFTAFGEKARSGNIMEVDGKLINPAALGEELANNQVKIAELSSQSAGGEVDYKAIEKAIIDRGGKINTPSANFKQKDADANNLAQFKRFFGKDAEIPMTASVPVNDKLIANYTARNGEISDILQRAGQPVDAEAALLAADTYYAKHYAPRFKNADVASIRRAGNEASGLKTEYEGMPGQFTNVSGAKSLKTAVGPKQAQDIMRQHYQYEMSQVFDNNPSAVASWVNRNKEALKEYGLINEFNTAVKQQESYTAAVANKEAYTKSIAGKILGTDDITMTIQIAANSGSPKKAFSELLAQTQGNMAAQDGIKTGMRDFIWDSMQNAGRDVTGVNVLSDAKAQSVLKRYRTAMEAIYSPAEMKAFDNVAKAIEIMQRDRIRVQGGGSATSQNMMDATKGMVMDSVVGPIGKLARGLAKPISGIGKDEINELIIRAGTDPSVAKQIQDAAIGGKWTQAIQKIAKRQVLVPAQITGKNILQLRREEE